jgi:hypothetical protein
MKYLFKILILILFINFLTISKGNAQDISLTPTSEPTITVTPTQSNQTSNTPTPSQQADSISQTSPTPTIKPTARPTVKKISPSPTIKITPTLTLTPTQTPTPTKAPFKISPSVGIPSFSVIAGIILIAASFILKKKYKI